MIIEQAEIEDAKAILDLQHLAYQSEAKIYNDYGIAPLTQDLAGIRADFERRLFLKTAIEGRIIGSVRAHLVQGTCFIGRLIVHPDFQNRGIGACLMRAVEARFPEAGRFELFTGHRSERNLYLYRKLGYRVFSEEKVSSGLTLKYLEKLASPAESQPAAAKDTDPAE